MTHLRIEQNSNNEVVSSALIHKLYTEAHAGLDSTSNLAGMLTVPHCKLSEKNYLENLYPGLTINCTEGYYIEFADPEVERIMSYYAGDGVGVTSDMALNYSRTYILNDASWFKGNAMITSFDELALFPHITLIYGYYASTTGGAFNSCTSLLSIDLKYITSVDVGGFRDCISLTTVKNFSLTRVKSWVFDNCQSLTNIDLSTVQYIEESGFRNTNIQDINCPSLISAEQSFRKCKCISVSNIGSLTLIKGAASHYGGGMFANCTNLQTVVIPATVTSIGEYAFLNDTALRWIKCLPTSVPTLDSDAFSGCNNTFKIYVPDAAVNDYKADSAWSTFSSRIFPVSQLATDFPND